MATASAICLAEVVDPPLTTIRLPAHGLGWGAADMLIREINCETIHQRAVLLETELVIRRFCGSAAPKEAVVKI